MCFNNSIDRPTELQIGHNVGSCVFQSKMLNFENYSIVLKKGGQWNFITKSLCYFSSIYPDFWGYLVYLI